MDWGSHDGQYVWAGHNMRYSNFDHNDEEDEDTGDWENGLQGKVFKSS